MNIYLIEEHGNHPEWDYYDSCVVIAENELIALTLDSANQMTRPVATLIGTAFEDEPQTVCSSFNAG